jgi:hypothetical protein
VIEDNNIDDLQEKLKPKLRPEMLFTGLKI